MTMAPTNHEIQADDSGRCLLISLPTDADGVPVMNEEFFANGGYSAILTNVGVRLTSNGVARTAVLRVQVDDEGPEEFPAVTPILIWADNRERVLDAGDADQDDDFVGEIENNASDCLSWENHDDRDIAVLIYESENTTLCLA